MLILVRIDLSAANLKLFERYEGGVLPLLALYRGTLIERVRSMDGKVETHFLQFADAAAREAFRAGPRRAARPVDTVRRAFDLDRGAAHRLRARTPQARKPWRLATPLRPFRCGARC